MSLPSTSNLTKLSKRLVQSSGTGGSDARWKTMSIGDHKMSASLLSIAEIAKHCSPLVGIYDEQILITYINHIKVRVHYQTFDDSVAPLQSYIRVAEWCSARHTQTAEQLKKLIEESKNVPERNHECAQYQLLLGDIYMFGMNGVARDPAYASESICQSAERGNVEAITWMGMVRVKMLAQQLNIPCNDMMPTQFNDDMCEHPFYSFAIHMFGLAWDDTDYDVKTYRKHYVSPFALFFVDRAIKHCGLYEELEVPLHERMKGATECIAISDARRMEYIEETRAKVAKIRKEKAKRAMKKKKQKEKKKHQQAQDGKEVENKDHDKEDDDHDESDAKHHDTHNNHFSALSISASSSAAKQPVLASTFTSSSSSSAAPASSSTSSSSSSSVGECLICLIDGDLINDPLQSRCHPTHLFHKLCLEKWLETCQTKQADATCPLCRTIIHQYK